MRCLPLPRGQRLPPGPPAWHLMGFRCGCWLGDTGPLVKMLTWKATWLRRGLPLRRVVALAPGSSLDASLAPCGPAGVHPSAIPACMPPHHLIRRCTGCWRGAVQVAGVAPSWRLGWCLAGCWHGAVQAAGVAASMALAWLPGGCWPGCHPGSWLGAVHGEQLARPAAGVHLLVWMLSWKLARMHARWLVWRQAGCWGGVARASGEPYRPALGQVQACMPSRPACRRRVVRLAGWLPCLPAGGLGAAR